MSAVGAAGRPSASARLATEGGKGEPTTLGEACEVNPGRPKLTGIADDTIVMFVPMAGVDEVTGTVAAPEDRALGDLKEKSYRTFAPGDVLFAKITPCMENGKSAVVPETPSGLGFGSTEFHVLRPRQGVDPRFIWHFVRQQAFRRIAEGHMTGSVGQLRVPAAFLKSYPITIPDAESQAEIVRLLDKSAAASGSAKSHLDAACRTTERFRQAVLAAACSGRLTADWRDGVKLEPADAGLERKRQADRNRLGRRYRERLLPDLSKLPEIPEEWCWAALPELGELGRGKSKHRPRNDTRLYGGRYPFIQTGDIARSGGRIVRHTQTYNEAGLAQSRLWPERTVCITIAANIADSALLTYPACFPDSVVGLVADEAIVVPAYVELFVRTARRDLAAFAPATAQANINLAILSELAVALPRLEEQHEIVQRASTMFALADRLLARFETASRRVDQSSQAVLAKAFRGDLLTTRVNGS